jgi:hypothetical protein
MTPFRVNLGGEGEVPGVSNQLGRWAVLDVAWVASQSGQTFSQLVASGNDVLIADNPALPLPDACADEVITDSMPLDKVTRLGPGVQSSEVLRILKSGGVWLDDGLVRYRKP